MRTRDWVIVAIAALACTISIAACTASIVESYRLDRTLDHLELPRSRR